ncbi:MAG: B12-binding domain-containing radical SAM protein [Candidatus Thorarchaeota archaeon]
MVKTKTVLVATHQISMDTPVPLFQCLGVLSLAASLNSRSLLCEVIDLIEYSRASEKDPETMIAEISFKVLSAKPDVLGLSTMSSNLAIALQVCKTIKAKNPSMTTVLGGPGVSFCAREIMNSFPYIDAVIRGEADEAFPDFIESLGLGNETPTIKGVVIRDGPSIIDNGWPTPIQDLDSLPVPLYELCRMTPDIQKAAISIEVGRGCPFACTFCSTSAFFKRDFRVKSVKRILEEISLIRSQFTRRSVLFNHDLLTFNNRFINELCDSIMRLELPIEWSCSARLDTINEEMLRKMRNAGCEAIFLGIEAATDRMQKKINKRLNLESFTDILATAVELGFKVTISFIVGIPGMNREDIQSLWSHALLAKSLGIKQVTIQVHSLAPELGSALYQENRSNLEYDDYGCIGNTNIPPAWKELRRNIIEHPNIFPDHFFIRTKGIRREEILKHTFLSYLVDAASIYSIQEAYSSLGERLSDLIANNIHSLSLPTPPHWPKLELVDIMQSLRSLILKELPLNSENARRYDSIAQWEIAAREVLNVKPEPLTKVIDVFFDPLKLIEAQLMKQSSLQSLDERQRFLAVFWDPYDKEMKHAEIPSALASLITRKA